MRRPDAWSWRLGNWAAVVVVLALGIGVVGAQERAAVRGPRKDRTLWFFFAPSQRGLAKEVRRIGEVLRSHPEIGFRPCLVVDDWSLVRRPSQDFAETVKALRSLIGPEFSLPLWDDEGLALARAIGVERVPAYALIETAPKGGTRRAHLAYGQGAKIEEILRCR